VELDRGIVVAHAHDRSTELSIKVTGRPVSHPLSGVR